MDKRTAVIKNSYYLIERCEKAIGTGLWHRGMNRYYEIINYCIKRIKEAQNA